MSSFSYTMILTCEIADRAYEFHKDFISPVQFQIGDRVYINGLEEVVVKNVVWYLNDPGHAFVSLEDKECAGEPGEWACILEDMDYCVPDL